jgi:hypothetical protein
LGDEKSISQGLKPGSLLLSIPRTEVRVYLRNKSHDRGEGENKCNDKD